MLVAKSAPQRHKGRLRPEQVVGSSWAKTRATGYPDDGTRLGRVPVTDRISVSGRGLLRTICGDQAQEPWCRDG